MMRYKLEIRPKAKEHLRQLLKNEPKAYQKALSLIAEIQEHPRTGTGKPEPLSADRAGQWSRRINHKHRLVYEIHDFEIVVIVISVYGHYGEH